MIINYKSFDLIVIFLVHTFRKITKIIKNIKKNRNCINKNRLFNKNIIDLFKKIKS